MAETKWEFDKTKVLKPTSAPRSWAAPVVEEPAPVVEAAPTETAAEVVEPKAKKSKKDKEAESQDLIKFKDIK